MTIHNAFSRLPEVAAARLPSTGRGILIRRGEQGYYPMPPGIDPDEYNKEKGIDAYQAQAMLTGSMFNWETGMADPDTYRDKGLVPVPGQAFTELQVPDKSQQN